MIFFVIAMRTTTRTTFFCIPFKLIYRRLFISKEFHYTTNPQTFDKFKKSLQEYSASILIMYVTTTFGETLLKNSQRILSKIMGRQFFLFITAIPLLNSDQYLKKVRPKVVNLVWTLKNVLMKLFEPLLRWFRVGIFVVICLLYTSDAADE